MNPCRRLYYRQGNDPMTFLHWKALGMLKTTLRRLAPPEPPIGCHKNQTCDAHPVLSIPRVRGAAVR